MQLRKSLKAPILSRKMCRHFLYRPITIVKLRCAAYKYFLKIKDMYFLLTNIKYLSSGIRAAQIQCLSTCAMRYNFYSSHLNPNNVNRTKIFFYNAKSRYKGAGNTIFLRSIGAAENTPEDFEEKSLPDTEDHADSLKFGLNSLIYNEIDELMKQLNGCKNLTELHGIFSRNAVGFQIHHYVQSIIILNDLKQENKETNEIIEDELYKSILEGLKPNLAELNMNELSCSYLYLRKLKVPNTEPVMRDLLIILLKKLNDEKLIQLPVLSRLSIAVNIGHDFYMPMICANFLPHVLFHVNSESCYTQETAYLIAICFQNMYQIIDQEILCKFKERIQELLDTNVLNSQTPKAIMKLLQLFNMPHWSNGNSLIVRNLLLTLKPSISEFNEQEIKILSRVFQHHLEPATLESPLKEALEKQLEVAPSADALACYMPFIEPVKRNALINTFKTLLNSSEQWELSYSDINFFVILRTLKISEKAVCDKYWDSILKRLEDTANEELTQQRFLRHCHRYMHFNNNLGGTYRFLPLERKLTELAMNSLEHEIAGSIPWKVSRLVSFIFAYGHTPYSWKKFPNTLLSKIITMANQFSLTDCLYISRGIQICLEFRFRFDIPSTLNMQLATIDNILLSCIERYLQENDQISIQNLNILVRTLNNRKTLKNSLVYQQAMNKYKTIEYENLNSRTIRDLAYILNASNYITPEAMKAMFDYIGNAHDYILGDTVEKVLTCGYNLGYVPEFTECFNRAAQTLLRDFDLMSGLSIVQACLALCFYKTIPEELINKVFCVDFIKRIENEIQLCYSKATYPERVLNQVMQLNRTVCLDFPEANVPWFQQNYIEAQMTKKPVVRHKFNDEVRQMLTSLLKEEHFFRFNHTTPYGYQIDFVIHFDHKQKPIPTPVETTILNHITKVAILLLKLDSFCENDFTALHGPESLKTKHLEMMGYKVLHINEHDWNSKYMKVPGAKSNYLKCLLQINS